MSQEWVELQIEQKTQNLNQDGVRTLALLIVTGLNIMETTYPGESNDLRWPQMTSDDLRWPQWHLKISTELDLTNKWRVWLWLWERLVLLGDSFLVSYSILKFRSKIFLKNSSCLVFWNVCSWRRKMWMW